MSGPKENENLPSKIPRLPLCFVGADVCGIRFVCKNAVDCNSSGIREGSGSNMDQSIGGKREGEISNNSG